MSDGFFCEQCQLFFSSFCFFFSVFVFCVHLIQYSSHFYDSSDGSDEKDRERESSSRDRANQKNMLEDTLTCERWLFRKFKSDKSQAREKKNIFVLCEKLP